MKGDLDSASGDEFLLDDDSFGSNQGNTTTIQTEESSRVGFDVNTACKRIKADQVNDFIVYTRANKRRYSKCDEFVNNVGNKKLKREPKIRLLRSSAVKDKESLLVDTKEVHVLNESVVESSSKGNLVADTITRVKYQALENVIQESCLVEVLVEESPANEMVTIEIPVEILIEESHEGVNIFGNESSCFPEMPKWIEGPTSEPRQGSAKGARVVVAEGSEVRNGMSDKSNRRFTRSALKWKEEERLESLDYEVQETGNEVVKNTDGVTNNEGSPLNTLKNLEMKMSKNIAINKRPLTVKELFDTGILDGVSVVYMGSVKSQVFGLRGTIQDGGILCSCSLCHGCRVIPPSKFEIHACKQYRRAVQYICFENGKSLLEVLKACKSVPLHTLEATILSLISSSPEEKTFTCKRCKATFSITSLGQRGPLCNICFESKKSQGTPTCKTVVRARSSDSVLAENSSTSGSVCISSQNRSLSKIKRKSSGENTMPKSSNVASAVSTRHKRPWKIGKKSSKPGSTLSSRSVSAYGLLRNKSSLKLAKLSKRQDMVSKSLKNVSMCISSQKKGQRKATIKDQRLHKSVFENSGLPDGTVVAYYARGKKLLEGLKKGFGILCFCCNSEVSPSQFEAHAGWASRRKPYEYIYTSNGVSLHELALAISEGRKYSSKDNDDICIICADGGNLLLCDGCPRAFHKECASLPSVPPGKWFCKYCKNKFEHEKFVEYNVDAVAAGRVPGVDPIEEITRGCIQIVKNIESELTGCVLCWGSDFRPSGFGPRTILICDQCEKEFHVGCLKTHGMADLKELPKGKWFCCTNCTRINSTLQNLLDRGPEKLPDSLLEILRKKCLVNGLDDTADMDIRWRLISAKTTSSESRLLLSQALAIFNDCFVPIVDAVTGRNLIPCMVYGKNMKSQDYGGMCCAVLIVNSCVVSAGVLRVFGCEVAELPLVATSMGNQGKGYFQLLFSCIMKMLSFLNVESVVLPAAEQAEPIWMNKFGFKRIEPEQLSKYRRNCCQIVRFKGSSMLQKSIPPSDC